MCPPPLAALYQEKNSLAHVGGDYLPAGGEADYILPATGPIVTAIGAWSWKTYTLDAAVAMLLTVAGEGAPPAGAAAAAKVGASASKVPPAKLARVGLCLGDKLFSEPPTSAASAIRDNIGCLGELNDIWLAPLALVQGLIIDLAGALDARPGPLRWLGRHGHCVETGPSALICHPEQQRAGSVPPRNVAARGERRRNHIGAEGDRAAAWHALPVHLAIEQALSRVPDGPPEQMKVAVVEVTQKGVRTDRGIGVGNTEAEVTAAYPRATVMMLEPTVKALVEDFPDGTAVRFSLDPATNTVDYLLGGDQETVHAYEICS